jgi:hypothetical protein
MPHLAHSPPRSTLPPLPCFQLKKDVKKALRAAAKANEELRFVESAGESANRLLQYFGVAEEDLPALLVFDTEAQAKYLKRGFKAADIPEFLREHQVRA